ncbi:MAG TPA: 3-methyl-2-oxobutanoate hydroxymethyltransferase [Actinomycetota bacterium]|nr:3-methyl-2-oxobutanoate hydroxymethyltransferase [Actinomycetota bacterium]
MAITVRDIRAFKERGEKFVMLTCYDAPSARILHDAGIPILFVGDTLGMVVLGHSSTIPVTIDVMVHHVQAVRRGAPDAFVLGDMPFMSYQTSVEEGIRNAGRLLQEGGANAVKLEGGGPFVTELVHRLAGAGIPVMGHLGLTPQSVNQFGGYPVQGRDAEGAQRILQDAKDLEAAGTFAIVLETVPQSLAGEITRAVSVPTIGIGAGPDTDGQVLVFHDFLGITPGRVPRFVKRYAEIGDGIGRAAREFAEEVANGAYPGPEHSYD